MKNGRRTGRDVAALGLALACGAIGVGRAQQAKYPYPTTREFAGVAPPPVIWASPPLGDGPFLLQTAQQRNIRVVVVTKGLSHPWSLAFLPEGGMLVTEREGRLRIVRNGKLDPNPVTGAPRVVSRGTMAGLMDIALHPRFVENRWIYISYHKPVGDGLGSNSIMRPNSRRPSESRICRRSPTTATRISSGWRRSARSRRGPRRTACRSASPCVRPSPLCSSSTNAMRCAPAARCTGTRSTT